MVSPLRMSLWMAPSSPMMIPDSGETLYRCLEQGELEVNQSKILSVTDSRSNVLLTRMKSF